MSADQSPVPARAGTTEANLFDIPGPIAISYSRSSFSGRPQLSYRDAQFDLSFDGDEIVRVKAGPLELVTVTLQLVIDAVARTFTLVVPTVRIGADSEVAFETVGLDTTDTSIAFGGPAIGAGVKQAIRVHQLAGTARAVDF